MRKIFEAKPWWIYFSLKFNIKEYNYYPDFKIDDKFYEIKGIKSKNSLAKQKYNKDVIFLYKNDIKFYINYVINKYGKHFIDLYDKKDKIK